MENEPEQWITVTEAAKLVGVVRSGIHYHIPRNHFKTKRVGSVWLVHRESLLEWYEKEAAGDKGKEKGK